jgi:DNA polymerase III alpha subunit
LNRKSLEVLIKSGAMDPFGERGMLPFNVDTLLEFHKRVESEAASGQSSLFAGTVATEDLVRSITLKPAPPATRQEILTWERELLGLFLSEHPYAAVSEQVGKLFTPVADLVKFKKMKSVRCGGILTEVKKIYTKTGDPMVFARFEDRSGSVEAVVFPRVLKEHADLIELDKILSMTGRPQEKDGEMKILVETCFELTPQVVEQMEREAREREPGTGESRVTSHEGSYELRVTSYEEGAEGDAGAVVSSSSDNGASDEPVADPTSLEEIPRRDVETEAVQIANAITLHLRAHLSDTILHRLRECCDKRPGTNTVFFKIDDVRGPRIIKSSYHVAFSEELTDELEALLGPGTVSVGSSGR